MARCSAAKATGNPETNFMAPGEPQAQVAYDSRTKTLHFDDLYYRDLSLLSTAPQSHLLWLDSHKLAAKEAHLLQTSASERSGAETQSPNTTEPPTAPTNLTASRYFIGFNRSSRSLLSSSTHQLNTTMMMSTNFIPCNKIVEASRAEQRERELTPQRSGQLE
ncbi:hypothetical protein MMC31_001147 [Peltigera leucophlebia]|nr:hypothetical protein [Peltigera leucophlebia]